MVSSSIQENVDTLLQVNPQVDIQIIPIEDHSDPSGTLERLGSSKASQVNFEFRGIRLKRNNQVANLSPKKNIDGYNPIINFIKKCCISEAFIGHPTAMYASYLNEYWYTAKYNDETKLISFTTKNASFEVKFGVRAFRTICGFEYLENRLEYDNEPLFEEIQKTMLGVGYRKGNGPSQPLESTLLKTGFSPTWRLLMAYITNSLGGNIGSMDQLNFMHQLIAHGLINGVDLDYGGIIFSDLAAKLTNPVRHTSPAYPRFISLILEKVLGDSYLIYDETCLKIPIMGNSIFSLDPTSFEVSITPHMVRICESVPDPAVVSEDVAGILMCDHVSDGNPSMDSNLNEIGHTIKTKSINNLSYPNSKESTGVHTCAVVTNSLNVKVVADTAFATGHYNVRSFHEELVGDIPVHRGNGENLKDDCPVIPNQVYSVKNIGDDQNLKDACPVNSNEVCNYQNDGGSIQEEVGDTTVHTGTCEHLKDNCPVISNQVCSVENNGVDQCVKDGCPGNSNEVSNYQNAGGYLNEVQTESNLFAIMVSKQVSVGQSLDKLIVEEDDIMNVDCDDECQSQDVNRSVIDACVLNVLVDHVRLLSDKVSSLVNDQALLKDNINKLIPSFTPSTELLVAEVCKCVNAFVSSLVVEIKNGIASGQKEIHDEVSELKKSLSSTSSTDAMTKDVIYGIQPELKDIKDHISKIEALSFPTKESLVAEVVKCIQASNSIVSKDVTHLISKQKELSDEVHQLMQSSLLNTSTADISKAVYALVKPELKSFVQSVTDSFLKTKVNIHVPEDFTMVSQRIKQYSENISSILNTVNTISQRPVQLSPEFASLPAEIRELRSTMIDIVNFKAEISNLASMTQENVSTFKEFSDYFASVQSCVDAFYNLVKDRIPSKKEREDDQQLLEVVSMDQKSIKDNNSKIADCMMLLVKWAKSIYVDDSASTAKTTVGYEEAPLEHAERDVTEVPLGPESNVCHGISQVETSLHVGDQIHTTSNEREGKQHIVAELSNKNEISELVSFRYEADGVEHVMTCEEIAKQKEDEEIIRRKIEDNKASYDEVMRVLEEEKRTARMEKVRETRAEEDKQLEIKYTNRKVLFDRYVRTVNPVCRVAPEKITSVDIISKRGPISVMIFRENTMEFKVHNPLNLRDFNYEEWIEIRRCVARKTSKQAKVILQNIDYRVQELGEIERNLGLMSGVPLSELDPMIQFHELMKKRRLDAIEMEGSFVAGMECDLSIPLELVNKQLVVGQVLDQPEFGMFFKNTYMHGCFIRIRDICKCSLERLHVIKNMYYHRYKHSEMISAEKEFISLVEEAIQNKNAEYPPHKRIKLERMDNM